MALPPEPLEDVLSAAHWVVLAEVTAVQDLAPWPTGEHNVPLDGAAPRPAQQVTLRVTRVLRGAASDQLVVTKPAGAYALFAGAAGPFLVDATAHILGRYGPDTWPLDALEHALSGAA